MKTHKVRSVGIAGNLDGTPDTFTTWCGISDLDNPSEDLIENLVGENDSCTCKNCQKSYESDIKRMNEMLAGIPTEQELEKYFK